MNQIPKDVTLVMDAKRPRIDAESAAMSVNCLARDDGPRNLTLNCASKVKGERGAEWVEASALWDTGLYTWIFQVTGGMITELLLMTSPKGSEFSIDEDGGSPFDYVGIEDRKVLTEMIVTSKQKKCDITVVSCFIVSVNGARPYGGGNLFYTEEEANAARDEQEEHYRKYSGNTQKIEQDKIEKRKEIAKAQTTVAFKSKSRGLKKKK